MPRFSVLLPVLRPPVLLPFAIETVLAQSVADFELLVVCDGAPDETAECARAFGARDARVKTLVFDKGERQGEAHRHTALMQARGTMVAHICDDDLWFPNHLEEIGYMLAEADFGHVVHTEAHPDGSVTANACDLTAPFVREQFMNKLYNRFGPTSCAYRLDAYRRLPEGWAPAPAEVWTDLNMWRKFLRREDFKFASRAAITSLHLPAPERHTMSLTERAAENKYWRQRIQDPVERSRLAEQAMRSLNEQSIGHEIELGARQRQLEALVADRAERQAEIERILRSKSWRWTAPLRALRWMVNRDR